MGVQFPEIKRYLTLEWPANYWKLPFRVFFYFEGKPLWEPPSHHQANFIISSYPNHKGLISFMGYFTFMTETFESIVYILPCCI